MKKRTTKRKTIVLNQIVNSSKAGIELYRKVRCFAQLRESGKERPFTPEYYIRSFNRTIKDNFFIQQQDAHSLPSYFVFLDLYFGLVESRTISSNFPKQKLHFVMMANTCAVTAEIAESSYCQIAQIKIPRQVYFICKCEMVLTKRDFRVWSGKESLGIKTSYVLSDGSREPVSHEQPIRRGSVRRLFLEPEDLYIDLGDRNFVGFS